MLIFIEMEFLEVIFPFLVTERQYGSWRRGSVVGYNLCYFAMRGFGLQLQSVIGYGYGYE